ncbi:MAG: hypothetical protein HWD59_01910 [Coxiellaceae bacterium]|nr:MAG: hypothetical protein HWD59_01910 [Coxiellaceae bacterium]
MAQTFSFACFFDDESLADLLTILTTKEVMIWLSSDIHSITLLQEEDDAYWYSDPNFKKARKRGHHARIGAPLKKAFFGLLWA